MPRLRHLSLLLCLCACPRPTDTSTDDAGPRDASQLAHDAGTTTPTDGGTTADAGLPDAAVPDAGAPACQVGTPADALTVPTTRGLVRGAVLDGALSFKGIPFAAPPVGDLRLRPPQPPACWEGVRDATAYGSRCVQRVTGTALYSGDEDCLFLNVWRPAPADGGVPAGLPVMFFIHGGANILGSADENGGTAFNLYDGTDLAARRDVVVVSTNYRLGALGFLAHPALTAEDAHGSSGNYALLDLVAALHWVQDNIASFGGDPSRVMVFGESAGALNTCMLLSSPLASGLFQRALMESGSCRAPPLAERESVGRQLAAGLGCSGDDVAACLRGLTPFQLTSITPVEVDMLKTWDLPFGANVDGWVLPRAPLETIAAGQHNRVPFIIGTNADETELFLPAVVNTCLDYATVITAAFPNFATAVLAEYPCLAYLFPRWAAVDASTDVEFTCPARTIARTVAGAQAEPVRRYHYRHIRPYGPLAAERAFHASELPYVFGTYDLGYVPLSSDDAVSEAIQSRWARFAATGDVDVGGVDWPLYDVATDPFLVIQDPLSTDQGLATEHCDFWDGISP